MLTVTALTCGKINYAHSYIEITSLNHREYEIIILTINLAIRIENKFVSYSHS